MVVRVRALAQNVKNRVGGGGTPTDVGARSNGRQQQKSCHLEALVIGNIIAKKHRLRSVDIVANHLSTDSLATDVPNLEGDIDLSDGQGSVCKQSRQRV